MCVGECSKQVCGGRVGEEGGGLVGESIALGIGGANGWGRVRGEKVFN